MPPQFRDDLQATKEEQQGVAFYRIDDPGSQASFRLYEIEYMIARKLDGSRELPDVISAIKSEYNFDISIPDLQKFVGTLESMGFIVGSEKSATASTEGRISPEEVSEVEEVEELEPIDAGDDIEEVTAVYDRDAAQGGEPEFQTAEVDTDVSPRPQGADTGPSSGRMDVSDLRRMLISALEHLRSGYIVHARDYFVAAQAASPSDTALSRLVARLEGMEEPPTRSGLSAVWKAACDTYPDLVAEVGEDLAPEVELADGGDDDDLRTRVIWTLVLLAILAIGGGALFWVMKSGRLFEGSAQVRSVQIHPERVAVYFDAAATSVTPAQEEWLVAAGGGKVAKVTPVGTKVAKGDVVASLELDKRAQKAMAKAQKAVAKAQKAYSKAAGKLEKLNRERERVTADRDEAQSKLKELRPKSVLKGGGVSKRDLEKYKKALVKANRKLSQLSKKARKPQKAERKARTKLEAAEKKLRALESKNTEKFVRAPFAGTVAEVTWKVGDRAKDGSKVLRLRDSSAAKVTFSVKGTGNLSVGGTAQVSVAKGQPTEAKVVALNSQGETTTLSVLLPDPVGGFVETEPGEFRLVRHHVDPAFVVAPQALVPVPAESSGPASEGVFLVLQGRLKLWPVDVVVRQPHQVVIRSSEGTLRDGDRVVVENQAPEGSVVDLKDGMSVAESDAGAQ